jgi:hypothetical protein
MVEADLDYIRRLVTAGVIAGPVLELGATYCACIAALPVIDLFEGAIHPVGERPNGNHHAPINTTGGYLWSCNLLAPLRRSVCRSFRYGHPQLART